MRTVNVTIPKPGSKIYEVYFDETECIAKVRETQVVSVTVFYNFISIETQYTLSNRLGVTVFPTKAQAEKEWLRWRKNDL